MTKSEEGSEEVVCLEPGDHPVSGDGGGIHVTTNKNNAEHGRETKDSSQQDDNDHDVVAPDVE